MDVPLTLMPSKRARARRGLRARSVRRDLMAVSCELRALATRLMRETYTHTHTLININGVISSHFSHLSHLIPLSLISLVP